MKSPLLQLITAACDEYIPSDALCPCILSAMAKNDSAFATAGIAKRTKNPANQRCSADIFLPPGAHCIDSPGNGSFQAFPTLQDGIRANVSLYARKFAGRTPEDITWTWAQTVSPQYHADVARCFP